MIRITLAVMAVLVTFGAFTACYNKTPKEQAPAGFVR